ncbi:protein-disulfide reductase DsbD family protein [Fretibacter rubidus]|uniref:protein-disulfide reductase DsbD family protein n=1 Tax=Fretibacter rubidus TaxID=570162 RepID=UPI003529D79B
MTFLTRLAALICALIITASQPVFAAESENVDTGKVLAQLVSSHDTALPGATIDVALRTVLDDKWHTYWRNPGDSGEPVQLTWSLPEGASAGDIVWPLPMAIATGPIVNYGFEGAPLFPVPITLPEDAVIGSFVTIEADAYYLVCYDICIPEQATLSLEVFIGEPALDERWNNLITLAKTRAPKPGNISGDIYQQDKNVLIDLQNLPEGDFREAFFFSYDQGIVLPAAPQELDKTDTGITLETTGDFWWDAPKSETLDGVLRFEQNGRAVGEVVRLNLAQGFPARVDNIKPAQPLNMVALLGAMGGALLGGLILNLMPCVFPVISIKALSLTKTAHDNPKTVRAQGWFYTAGVMVTFMVLTVILLIIKAAGQEIGWGFQLQSPIIVGALALLLFAIGLNLLGIFEIGTGLQNAGSGVASMGGASGAFFTGALAVVVATPCTAPLMAGAIGYALAQNALVTIVIFVALAIGFALPFLLLSYAPKLLTRLPKPGPWMVRFKEFLAFPMLLAAVWLVWVLSLQAGDLGVGKILIAMVLLAFGIWALKGSRRFTKAVATLSIFGALIVPFTLSTTATSMPIAQSDTIEAWSPARITELNAQGKNVFVDFTAAWCVTCKVNERLVLDTQATKDLFADTNTVKMIADWTNKNDAIAQELARHGRSGVPLYLVYRADNNAVNPQILPQVLSQSVLRDALMGN